MDPHPPFDYPHHRRAHPGHHYPDPHRQHYADQHLAGAAAPPRSRYDYDSRPVQYLPSDHQHHLPRIHHQPPPPPPPPPPLPLPLPPPPPLHRLDTPHYAPLPFRAPPETYSPPPYRSLSPHRHYRPQLHGGDDFRAADEIRRHNHHHQMQEQNHHHHHQPQVPWEEAEEERRRYAALQLRLSPSESRKRHHCALHDSGDLESTSSSGPPPRRQRQHTGYSLDENFVDRTSSHSGYSRHEGFVMHSDSNRKMQTSASTMLPDSPHKMDAGYPRRAPQKSAPARVSVWQRIEENPSVYTPSSPHQLPKEVHISPSKTKNTGYASKELASVISLDCKAISPSKTKSTGSASKESPSVISIDHKAKSVNGKNTGDNGGANKSTGKKSEKVLASVLVKPSPESKEKGKAVKQATRKPDKVQNNVPGFSNGSGGLTARPGMGVKKVKKIVIKKIVRKIGASDKQTSSSVIPEQKDAVDANANVSEKEEGEITTSSFEKDDSSAHNSISTSDTAGVGSSVGAEKEQNDCLINPCKREAASAIESVCILDTVSVSRSQHPEKEDDKSLMKIGDTNATSVVDSTQVLDTVGHEHPEDRGCMDPGSQSAALLCENGSSHMEEDGIAVSGAMNAVDASNSPRIPETMKLHEFDVSEVMMGNNAVCVNGVKDDTSQVWESTNTRRENSNIFLDSNGEGDLFTNNSFRSPNTTDASVITCKAAHRKEGTALYVASLGDSMETSKIAEPSMTKDTRKEEGTVLTSPRERVAVSPWGTLNSMELDVNEDIQDKDGRILMEPSKANTSITHHVSARYGLQASFNEDIQEKECITSIELCEAASSVTQHKEAPNKMEFIMNENIQKKESQLPTDSTTLKITQHIETPNQAEIYCNKVFGSAMCRGHNDSDETHISASDNSIGTPDFFVTDGTEDSRTQELLHDQRIVLDKSNLHQETADMELSNFPLAKNVESSIMMLAGDTTEDSSDPIILNNDLGKDTISEAAEPMHLHRADLSPANSEHSLPTALTLGNDTYFSSAESEKPKEYHNLMEISSGLDDVTATEFGGIEKGRSESDNDLIKADAHNWLTLPLTVGYVNNDATVSLDRFDLEQNVDEGTSVSQDLGNMADMDQCGSIDSFDGEDHSLKLSCSNASESDLLALKGRNKNIENGSEIVLPEPSVCSVNVLDQYGYSTIDKPIDNINKPLILSSQSAGVTGEELTSEVHVDSGHINNSNTTDPMVESSKKPDLLSSCMEAIASEATKQHQPCKSTPDTFFVLKEDTRKTLPDPIINSASNPPSSMSIANSTAPKVPTKTVALPGSSREVPRLNQNARHRTWHRDNVSSSKSYLHASQPSGLPPKLPLKKNGKSQSCYIRKGNALIRNPATGNHPQSSSSALDAPTPSKLNKPIVRRSMNLVRKVDSNGNVAHSNVSVERPKTPPLPLHTKSVSTNISEPLSQSLQKQQVPETEKKDSSGRVNSGVDNPHVSSVQKSEPLDAGKVVYARLKSNQLVASQGQQSCDSVNSSMDKVLLQPSTISDLYFKKTKNQIILGSSSDVLSSKEMNQTKNSNTGETKVLMFASSNKNPTVAKDRPHKVLQTTNTVGSFSHVWTLSGQLPQRKPSVGTSHVKAFPCILPWKRKVFSHNYRSNYSSLSSTSSLGIVRKLLKTRKRGTVYTVSTNGFSLRKSGLLSCDRSSLKWSRSLQKDPQKEATLAGAEIDRKKREKRKRQSSDSRVPSTFNEYVRINKGNQLVRNPKKVIRILASEKVRWSLHTVRSRLAKKQQYCQFFTRFGECKKSGGKCPYIHDRAKVAICTKFLKGLCSNASCKLTHKVLPERMPDCSYFLRGLCSNTTCPYRHVKVNMNAPVCEDFLKGYCADGDECRKKHSYVCPVFEATGECPQQSRCKLHHPKKKIKSKRSRVDSLQSNSWGRYFDSSIGEDSEAMRVCSEEEEKQKQEHAAGGDLADFIDLGTDIDGSVELDASDNIHLMELDSRNIKMQADNLDALIKPLRIMRTARV